MVERFGHLVAACGIESGGRSSSVESTVVMRSRMVILDGVPALVLVE